MNPKLLSVLLAYPDDVLLEGLPELRAASAALPRGERRALEPVLAGLAALPLSGLSRAYV